MKLANPQYIYLFLLLPLFALIVVYGATRRKAALNRFASEAMLARIVLGCSRLRRNLKIGLSMGAMLFLVLCLLGPRWGFHWEEVRRQGVDIVIALDTSESMLSRDVKPNRLDQAKYEIHRLIGNLKSDRVALLAFAGKSFVQCPLTTDYASEKLLLDSIDIGIIS